jgi:hypothetical protein
MRRNGRDAPIPDLPAIAPEPGGSTRTSRSLQVTATVRTAHSKIGLMPIVPANPAQTVKMRPASTT